MKTENILYTIHYTQYTIHTIFYTWVLLHEVLEHLSHKSVLAHEDLSLASHTSASLVHLLGSHVIHLHNEHLGVGADDAGHLDMVPFLLRLGERHLK